MDRLDDGVRCRYQKSIKQMAALDRVGFGAASGIPFPRTLTGSAK
jgi:hypothetical protein